MARQFLPQSRDLRGGNRSALVPPLLANVGENVGDLRVSQRFVPRLHDGCPKLHALYRDRALQSFEHDHGRTARSAINDFGTGERRVTLPLRTESVGLMANGAVGRENLFAAIGLREFGGLFATRTVGPGFLVRRHESGIQTVAAEISREPAEICAAEKDGEAVNRDEPDRERFETGARLALLALNRGVHLVNVRRFAVIHPLAHVTDSRRVAHFFSSLAGAGDAAAAGDDAGAGAEVSLASLSSCD